MKRPCLKEIGLERQCFCQPTIFVSPSLSIMERALPLYRQSAACDSRNISFSSQAVRP